MLFTEQKNKINGSIIKRNGHFCCLTRWNLFLKIRFERYLRSICSSKDYLAKYYPKVSGNGQMRNLRIWKRAFNSTVSVSLHLLFHFVLAEILLSFFWGSLRLCSHIFLKIIRNKKEGILKWKILAVNSSIFRNAGFLNLFLIFKC